MRKRSIISRRPRARTSASRWSRPMPRRKACTAPPRRRTRNSPRCSHLDLGDVEPSIAGPKRPQDRVPLTKAAAVVRRGARQGIWQGRRSGQAGAGPGQEFRPRPRRRGDRRHHLLHQHVEPVRDGGGGTARQEGAEEGLERQALGQDLAGAGLAGGDRLSRQGRAAAGPRHARLQSGRLWLHHLHRQFRAAARGDLQDHPRASSGGRLGAVGQPQFRGPGQSRRARQLSRLAAAGGGLCAGRIDDHRPRHRTARLGLRRRAGLSQGHLAAGQGDRQSGAQGGQEIDVQEALRRRVPRRSRMARDRGEGRRSPMAGARTPPMCRTRLTSPACRRRRRR